MSCGSVGQTQDAPACQGSTLPLGLTAMRSHQFVSCVIGFVGKDKVESLLLSCWFTLPRPVVSTQSAAKR